MLLVVASACWAATQSDSLQDYGVWRNPANSVHVAVNQCQAGACGTVIWANEKAKADSRKGGTENLIGLRLFDGFVRGKDQIWTGKVFVPDLNRTFNGTARLVEPKTLRVKGCVFGGIVCKSQDWIRIDDVKSP